MCSPEMGASHIRSCKVEIASLCFILLARLLIPAPKDGENSLNVCRRPDLRSHLFNQVVRLFGGGALSLFSPPLLLICSWTKELVSVCTVAMAWRVLAHVRRQRLHDRPVFARALPAMRSSV